MLGPVFRGYDPEQDRAVAIKAFSLDVTPERARELAADLSRLPALGLEHPAMVAPLAAGAAGSTVYLVQEYFVAESADVALKQYGPAPVPDAVRLIGQLAGALDTAAAAGVFHGALHPRDILVAPHEVRLTGLGVAGALERAGVRVPPRRPYAAPERVAGGPVSAPADVFSLACIAFELLTGRRPSQSGDTVDADTAAIEAPDAVALAEAFARALSRRPDDRHPSALTFAAALKHALTGEPLAAAVEFVRPRSSRAGGGGRQAPAEPEPGFELTAPPADEPTQPLPADLLLAEPLGTESHYDVSAALLDHEAWEETRAGSPESAPPELTEPEPVAPESAPPELAGPGPSRSDLLPIERPADEFSIETVLLAPMPPPSDQCEAGSVPLSPGPSLMPPDFEPVDTSPTDTAPLAASVPAAQPSPDVGRIERSLGGRGHQAPAGRPARRLVPLFGMLLLGVLLGFPAGYLTARRAQPAAPSASAPAQAPVAAPAAVPAPPPAAVSPAAAPDPMTAARPSSTTAPPSAKAAPAPPPAAAAPPAARQGQPNLPSARKTQTTRSKPAAFVGTLVVVSRPAGATVKLDGRTVGVTPLTLRDVAAGSHAVRLELDGYRVWTVSAQVTAGQQKTVSASLDRRQPRPGG